MQEIITKIIIAGAMIWASYLVFRKIRSWRRNPSCGCGSTDAPDCGSSGGCEGCSLYMNCGKKEDKKADPEQ